MPVLNEPRRFVTIEDGDNLKTAIEMTCRELGVEKDDAVRREIIVRAAKLARSGLETPQAIRDRIIHEAQALSDLAA